MFYARTFALLTRGAARLPALPGAAPFAQPIAWALFIAFLLHPLHALAHAQAGRPRNALSAALLTVLRSWW